MCGRYALSNPNRLTIRYQTYNQLSIPSSYNIAPHTINPVIARLSPNGIYLMRWGLIPFWAKDETIAGKMINARAEEIAQKPSFRKPIRTTRCLVPVSGFFEWKKLVLEGKEEKYPWYIYLINQPIFSLAAIFDRWLDKNGKEIYSYSIITTSPNQTMKNIHQRMPVIISEENENNYLNPKTPLSEILAMLTPYPDKKMKAYPVEFSVNDPNNNYPDIVKPRKSVSS